jgi:hypothetical protein
MISRRDAEAQRNDRKRQETGIRSQEMSFFTFFWLLASGS